jgi:hypothetical protein
MQPCWRWLPLLSPCGDSPHPASPLQSPCSDPHERPGPPRKTFHLLGQSFTPGGDACERLTALAHWAQRAPPRLLAVLAQEGAVYVLGQILRHLCFVAEVGTSSMTAAADVAERQTEVEAMPEGPEREAAQKELDEPLNDPEETVTRFADRSKGWGHRIAELLQLVAPLLLRLLQPGGAPSTATGEAMLLQVQLDSGDVRSGPSPSPEPLSWSETGGSWRRRRTKTCGWL